MNTSIRFDIHTQVGQQNGTAETSVNAIGYLAAWFTIFFALGYVAAQLLSWVGVIRYPTDQYWLFLPSLFLAPAFLVTMICLHYRTVPKQRIWTAVAAAFAVVYCCFATFTYFTQLGSIVPGVVRGEINETHPLIFKPRSFTMSVDCLGYFFMSLSTLFAAFAWRSYNPKLYGWMLGNGLLIILLVPAYFNPFLYYIGSVWAVSFTLAMYYTARLMSGRERTAH